MRQAIIWTNAEPIRRRIYAALGGGGGDEVNLQRTPNTSCES